MNCYVEVITAKSDIATCRAPRTILVECKSQFFKSIF